jgi:hypothetical protein
MKNEFLNPRVGILKFRRILVSKIERVLLLQKYKHDE